MHCNYETTKEANSGSVIGIPPLRTLYLYIAGACNLACRHCWITPTFDPEAHSKKFLRLELLKKAVLEAKPLGLSSVKLTGGEPMLHPQFREIVSFLAQEEISFTMETNGTLIDEETAEFLRDLKVMWFVSVSIDGADAATHDNLRGVSGCYNNAISGINSLVKVGFRPQLICTLHRGNLHQVDEVVKMAEDLGCGSVKFNHLQDMGRGTKIAESEGIPIIQLPGLYRDIDKRYRKGNIRVLFDIPIAFRSLGELLHSTPGLCSVHTILGILSSGEAALCGIGLEIPELVFGHLEKDDVAHIWNDAPGLKLLRKLIPLELEGICSNCIHRDRCLGMCIAQNYHETRKMNSAYKFCAQMDALGLFPASRKRVAFIRTLD